MQIQEKFLAQKRLRKSENVSKRFSVLFVVPLHRLGDRAVDEAVCAFAVRFGVCLNQVFFSLWDSQIDSIIRLCYPCIL